jgi:transketolase N-terminal domain/subunit
MKLTLVFRSNLSFVALQYQRFGYITNSMIVVNVLQALYVADLCINEHWYISPSRPMLFCAIRF